MRRRTKRKNRQRNRTKAGNVRKRKTYRALRRRAAVRALKIALDNPTLIRKGRRAAKSEGVLSKLSTVARRIRMLDLLPGKRGSIEVIRVPGKRGDR